MKRAFNSGSYHVIEDTSSGDKHGQRVGQIERCGSVKQERSFLAEASGGDSREQMPWNRALKRNTSLSKTGAGEGVRVREGKGEYIQAWK